MPEASKDGVCLSEKCGSKTCALLQPVKVVQQQQGLTPSELTIECESPILANIGSAESHVEVGKVNDNISAG